MERRGGTAIAIASSVLAQSKSFNRILSNAYAFNILSLEFQIGRSVNSITSPCILKVKYVFASMQIFNNLILPEGPQSRPETHLATKL